MSGAFFAHLLAYLYISGMEFHHSIKPIVVIITYSYRHHRKSVRHLEYDNLSWYVSQSVSDIFNRSAVLVELDPMDGPHQASSLQSMRVAFSDHSTNPVCGFRRARPVLHGTNSTEPNLFHHGETTYRVG